MSIETLVVDFEASQRGFEIACNDIEIEGK